MKPTLKPPGTKRLKLIHDEPLSKFAFKFNLRRYILVLLLRLRQSCDHPLMLKEAKTGGYGRDGDGESPSYEELLLTLGADRMKKMEAWAYTRPLFCSI
jgi:hypothetical protein